MVKISINVLRITPIKTEAPKIIKLSFWDKDNGLLISYVIYIRYSSYIYIVYIFYILVQPLSTKKGRLL